MEKARQDMIDKIVDAIKDFGENARKNENLTLREKALQVDVLIDTVKFLSDYEENIEILNKHYIEKRSKER